MSEPENSERENFLTRWSSRKVASRTPSARQDARPESDPRDAKGTSENVTLAKTSKDGDGQDNPPFDVAQLPPLDSIGADTDITTFLHRDVPPDLTRAALRRAWTSDPAIRDFVGLVESGWDFNDPAAMAGFGTISAEEVAQLASKLIGELPTSAPSKSAPDKPLQEISRAEASQPPALEPTTRAAADEVTGHAAGEGPSDAANDAPQQKDST
jgi:Protein of unknown function (DUF3306)